MSDTLSVKELFNSAAQQGLISPATIRVVADHGAEIQAGLGITAHDVFATEVVLLNVLIDDSSSIRMVAGNTEAIRQGYNAYLDAVVGAKKRDDVLVYLEMLNKGLVQPYGLLSNAIRLDAHNYNPYGNTPLYERAIIFLGTVFAKSEEFAKSGIPARTLSLIITDGADNSQRASAAKDVAAMVQDMLRQENHVIFGMGIDDGATDFRQVFMDMGIPDSCIRTPGNSPKEIRAELRLFSQSAVGISKGVSVGGFGS